MARYKAIDYYRSQVNKTEDTKEFIEIKDFNSAEDKFINIEKRTEIMSA